MTICADAHVCSTKGGKDERYLPPREGSALWPMSRLRAAFWKAMPVQPRGEGSRESARPVARRETALGQAMWRLAELVRGLGE